MELDPFSVLLNTVFWRLLEEFWMFVPQMFGAVAFFPEESLVRVPNVVDLVR